MAPIPKPDYLLVDKLYLNCLSKNIDPIICVNKCDIKDEVFIKCYNDYKDLMKVIKVSAKDKLGIDELKSFIDDKVVCFAGQSAVGKSSLINALLPGQNLKTDTLSRKTERGKHTTRHVELFGNGKGFIADTCGFSILDVFDADEKYLARSYFGDTGCKFKDCRHISEPECMVLNKVKSGKISEERYDRYIKLLNAVKEKGRKNEKY